MADGAAAETEGKAGETGDEGDKGDKAGETGDEGGKGGESDDDKLTGDKLDIEELLDEYGLDSPDDLKEFLAGLNEMKGKIGENDLDTLLENTKTLKTYQENWKQQEEEKLRDKETPEETIARLEKEKKDLQKKNLSQAERQKAAKDAERALDDFTDTVDGVIKNAKSLPKEYRPFVAKFMGVDNPINEVDITDKAAVRRLTKTSIDKDILKFEQVVIKRYLDGKIKIPEVSPTEPAPGSTGKEGKKGPKNLKEARRIMLQSVGAYKK